MSELFFGSLWCVAQVSLIAVVAIGLALLLTRRNPGGVARVLCGCAMMSVLLTIVVWLPVPGLADYGEPTATSSRTNIAGRAVKAEAVEPQGSTQPAMNPFGFIRIQSVIDAARQVRVVTPDSRNWLVECWLLAILLGLIVGCLRLAAGLFSIRQLRKGCREIVEEPSMNRLLCELTEEIHPGTPPRVVESAEIACAAVIGWFRPIIVLSAGWRDWKHDELRAVLAHEVAHIASRDAIWRFMAAFATGIHFLNPLMHWLTSRMVLAQELAADVLALKAVGQATYVRSLSRLALRDDSTSSQVRTLPLFAPVFAGHFMRRIEMLVAKDCTQTPRSRWLVLTTMVTLVLFGLVTTVARAAAQEEKKPLKVQAVSDSFEKAKGTAPAGLFQRERVTADHAVYEDSGAMHINVRGFAQQPVLRAMVGSFADSMCESIGLSSELELDGVESLFGPLALSYARVEPSKGGAGTKPGSGPNQVSIGTTGLALRTRESKDWDKLVQPLLAKGAAKEVTAEGVRFFEVAGPIGPPANGVQVGVRLVPSGDRELRVYITNTREDQSFACPGFERAHMATRPKAPEWGAEWDAVSGGLITLLWRVGEPQDEGQPDDEIVALGYKLRQKVDLSAWGIDLGPQLTKLAFRVRLRCRKGASAQSVVKLIANMKKALVEDSRAGVRRMGNDVVEGHVLQMLGERKLEPRIETVGDREVVCCNVELELTPEGLASMFGGGFRPAGESK